LQLKITIDRKLFFFYDRGRRRDCSYFSNSFEKVVDERMIILYDIGEGGTGPLTNLPQMH